MNLEQSLNAHLRAHAGLTALVQDRLYPLVLPQNVKLPAVSYFRVSRIVERNLSGPARTRARVQCSCWAETYATAKAVAAQIRAAVQDFQGVMGGLGGVYVLDANVAGEQDLFEDQPAIYHVPIDVSILYRGGE